MKGEWCYFKSYFNDEQCEKILNDGLKLPSQDAKLGVDGDFQDDKFRKSKIRFINKSNPEFKWLFDELWKMAIQANNDFFNIHITRLDYIQLAEYDSAYQGEYKAHHDVFWVNGDPVYHRKLSCVIQLTDPNTYVGGDLELKDVSSFPSKDDIRSKGTAVFFPSLFVHQAHPVLQGTRYSIAAWFEGPKWC